MKDYFGVHQTEMEMEMTIWEVKKKKKNEIRLYIYRKFSRFNKERHNTVLCKNVIIDGSMWISVCARVYERSVLSKYMHWYWYGWLNACDVMADLEMFFFSFGILVLEQMNEQANAMA